MAYVHCHQCGWSQDDFWDFSWRKYGYWHGWRYNPFSCFLSYVDSYIKPRRITFDKWVAKESGWKRIDPHSWWLIWDRFKSMIKKFIKQKWWFEDSYYKDKKKKCPCCGNDKLCVD